MENIYLIESKWDNLSTFSNDEIVVKEEQELRHLIFSWYTTHWDKKYSEDWESFVKKHMYRFQKRFPKRKIAPPDSLLAKNLQFILTMLQKHYGKAPSVCDIKNVLLFFYNKNSSRPPTKISEGFNLVGIDYGEEVKGNFITLG